MKDILTLKSLESAKIVAGEKGVFHRVNNIMVLEAPDVEKWISPNEILLSSLFGLSSFDSEEIAQFVEKLTSLDCACLIIKINRLVKSIPQSLIDACEKFQLTLIQIPLETRYHEIMFEVMQYLFNETNFLLERYRLINQRFIQLSLSRSSVKKIVELTSELLNMPVYIFQHTQKGIVVKEVSDKSPKTFNVETSGIPVSKEAYMNYDYFTQQIRTEQTVLHQIYVKIPQVDHTTYFLGVTETKGPITPIDYMTIENAVNFLQIEYHKEFAVKEVESKYKSDLFDDLITGRVDDPEKYKQILNEFQLDKRFHYRFIVFQFYNKKEKRLQLEKKVVERLIFKLKNIFSNIIYRVRSDRIIMIIPETRTYTELKTQLTQLLNHFIEKPIRNHLSYRVGISEKCQVNDFPKYSIQAFRVIQTASVLYTKNFIQSYNELGFYRFLVDITDKKMLASFIPDSLAKLNEEHPELIETLKIYLTQNQNIKQAASYLYIHPKTMSYRLKKIKNYLEISFEDTEAVLQIQIGLKIIDILNKKIR